MINQKRVKELKINPERVRGLISSIEAQQGFNLIQGSLKILIVFMILIFSAQGTTATILINESIGFSGSGIHSGTNAVAAGQIAGGYSVCGINSTYLNFNNNKIPTEIRAENTFHSFLSSDSTTTCTVVSAGINQKYSNAEAWIGNTKVADVAIGWTRLVIGQPTIRYEIYFSNQNIGYLSTLTGIQKIYYKNYVSNPYTDLDHEHTPDCGRQATASPTYVTMEVSRIGYGGPCAPLNEMSEKGTLTIYYISYDHLLLHAENTSFGQIIINVTKYAGNFKINITNSTGLTYYDVTSATDLLNLQIQPEKDVIVYMKSIISDVSTSRTIYSTTSSGGGSNTTTGTILFNKTAYDLYEDLNVSWNITNMNASRGYYLQVKNSDTAEIITSYNIATATGSQVFKNFLLKTPDRADYYEVDLLERTNLFEVNFLGFAQAYYGSSAGFANSTVTGNFSILNANKTVIQGGTLNLNVNLSTDGKIVIYDYKNRWEYDVLKGNHTVLNLYIPLNFEIGGSNIGLYYYDIYAQDYLTLYQDSFYVLPLATYSLSVGKDVYYQGDTITGKAFNSNIGYVNILDPNGVIIINNTIAANTSTGYAYKTTTDSPAGTWVIYLYDYNGVLLATKTTYLNEGIGTPTPGATVAPGTTGPTSLLEAGSQISDIAFGKWTDENGEVTEVTMKKQGNTMFSFLFGVCMICLLFGAWHSIKNQKKK